MDEMQANDWLIRDTSNRIRGPFKQAEIVQLIKKGQLKGKTEISRANSYWFAIEEKTELGRFLPEFSGGRPAPEQPTQMTATLTEADIQEHGMDITTFTAVPKELKENQAPGPANEGISGQSGEIEWLSDELAEEFGEFLSPGAQASAGSGESAPPEQRPGFPDQDNQATLVPTADEKKREELLKRATVKADTLPSEHKHFQGDRPKPIDTLMRTPGKPGASAISQHQHAVVNVPVEDSPAPKMIVEEDETKVQERRRRRKLALIFGLAGAGLAAAAVAFFSGAFPSAAPPPAAPVRVRRGDEAVRAARVAVLLFDLEAAKGALADLELEPGTRGESGTQLLHAIVKKEFLYDVEGALLSLSTARTQVRNRQAEAEVDNLMAVYGFDRDPAASLGMFRKNFETYKDDTVFRYNLALALLRQGHPQEALPHFDALLSSPGLEPAIAEDAALGQGWALDAICSPPAGGKDPLCRRASDAEEAYLRALNFNKYSTKARLGLALFRLRRGGVKASQDDFRAFIDAAPDLDPPSRIVNFRKLSNQEFYSFSHAQIVELNTPGGVVGKPSAIIMASDAIISGILGRTSEAGKILEGALSSAPGDANVLKAVGFLRWKGEQTNELVDSLKELRERNSFATNFLLGKAYLKLRKRDLAERHFRALVDVFPERAEGHSQLGELLSELPEKSEEAKAEYNAALKRDPVHLQAWKGLYRLKAPVNIPSEMFRNLPF